MVARPVAVLEYHLVGYRRTWRGSLLGTFALPLLTMLAFGVGVGGYIPAGVGGVSYLDYVLPGLVASTALQVAIGDSTWPVLGGFQWNRIFHAQAAGPPRVADIVAGRLAAVVLRAVVAVVAFLIVGAAFGAVNSAWVLTVPPALALLAAAVAAPTMAYSAWIPSDGYLALLFRVAVIPMTLFAGVFFPVESLPAGLRLVAYATPLWHGVDLCRAATLGVPPEWSATGHLAYLAAWAAVGGWAAARVFRRKLVD